MQAQLADAKFPKDYFSSPLRRPLAFSASFAELRPNHFHSGMDIRIGNKEGEAVYAPADGYVSRINISPWGGGQVLYITHPNGYCTVYMHLLDFAGEIGEWVRSYQYSHHVYAFDASPDDTIRVKKGQLIAHAGNSGSSGGPHLHYDIRYAHNDQPINPLYFGLPYQDNIEPIIRDIKVYPADDGAKINGRQAPISLLGSTNAKKGQRRTPWLDTLTVSGRFYTGIYATDISQGSPGKNGVERIELYVDDSLFFRYSIPTFLFEETRAINAILDYPEYLRSRRTFVVTRQLPGNHNSWCQSSNGNGNLSFAAGTKHKLTYVALDYKGNSASRTFWIKALAAPVLKDAAGHVPGIDHHGIAVSYFKRNDIGKPGFRLVMEEGTIYDNDLLLYSVAPHARLLSSVHNIRLQRNDLPPHKSMCIYMPVPPVKDTALRNKMVIVSINGMRMNALATSRQDDMLIGSARDFGSFGIALDTIAPSLTPVNLRSGGRYAKGTVWQIKVSDNLSGVATYHCYVNGSWVLSRYDGKTAALYIDPSAALHGGTNSVGIILTDAVGNKTEQTYTIYY